MGCQFTFATPLAFRRCRPLVAACVWGVAIVNSLTRVVGAVAHRAYDPGMLTGVALFVPLSAWVTRAASH
ncbi:MAG: hypothetical protein JWM10_2753 [Myxococcaceae bacterium]|nr:hypothetical protein [Myxococcaceae bacterium]